MKTKGYDNAKILKIGFKKRTYVGSAYLILIQAISIVVTMYYGRGTRMVEVSVIKNDAIKMHSTRALSEGTLTIVRQCRRVDLCHVRKLGSQLLVDETLGGT